MKNLKDPIGNRNRDHPACMQCLNQQRFRVKRTEFTGFFFTSSRFFPLGILKNTINCILSAFNTGSKQRLVAQMSLSQTGIKTASERTALIKENLRLANFITLSFLPS